LIKSLRVHETSLAPYFQNYFDATGSVLPHGELLSRPTPPDRPEAFFASLSLDDQLGIFSWLVSTAEKIYHSTGCTTSINIHNSLIAADEGRDEFLRLCDSTQVPLVLEFTETYPMPPIDASNMMLRQLREMGHKSALDDFGTGLNGMSLLTDYDFDIIKLDRSLTFDLLHRVEKQKTIKLIHQILDVLGKDHVAEGIETQEVLDILVSHGFKTFQGFLFAQPVPVDEFLTDRS
jgi:EAL domain-containing protein (putative c-di-GMP-specific phosphodiesterase class I)